MSDMFFQQILNWITLGSIDALIAVGFSLLFGVLNIIHFSHGDVSLVAPFLALAVMQAVGGALGGAPSPATFALFALVAILWTGLLGVLLDFLIIQRFRQAPAMMALVATVAWAAGNGDRSENGDYIYGKKRLREIDRRIRFLVKRLDKAEVVDPLSRRDDDDADRVFFGATVEVRDGHGRTRTISIVGVDEIDTTRGYISWMSPMARALIKAREGDTVSLKTPGGVEALEILAVRYEPLASG